MTTELLRAKAACKLLTVSRMKLNDLVREGRLTPVNLGPRSTRYRRSDIERLIDGKPAEPPGTPTPPVV